MEQPTTQQVYDLFNGRVQFQVPVYQRAYVWNEEKNWAVLWDDVADTADRYLDDPEAHVRHRHFLGPIVLSQEHSPVGTVDPRLVIDGQQRLTTLQIILSAAVAVARQRDADAVADDLQELTENRGRNVEGQMRFKVWPSRRDRDDFLATLESGAAEGTSGGIPGAWRFFHDRIDEWATDEGEADAAAQIERLGALQICLEKLLYVVSINLDESDNAQVIFETLNARGTGLARWISSRTRSSCRPSGRAPPPKISMTASGSRLSRATTTGWKKCARGVRSALGPTGSSCTGWRWNSGRWFAPTSCSTPSGKTRCTTQAALPRRS